MSLPEKVAAAQAAQAAGGGNPPSNVGGNTPINGGNNGGGTVIPDNMTDNKKKQALFKQQGHELRAGMSADQQAVEGTKCDTVEFVSTLGHPGRNTTRQTSTNGVKDYKATNVVVGYKVKILEDTTVPFAPYKSQNLLDVEPATEKPVKAGDVVALNIIEMAMFITRVEYAGRFTGGGKAVGISATMSAQRAEPYPVLKLLDQGAGSIKEGMELIGDMNTDASGRKTLVLFPEYEASFSKLALTRGIGNKVRKPKKDGEGQADIAAAFRNFFASKKA